MIKGNETSSLLEASLSKRLLDRYQAFFDGIGPRHQMAMSGLVELGYNIDPYHSKIRLANANTNGIRPIGMFGTLSDIYPLSQLDGTLSGFNLHFYQINPITDIRQDNLVVLSNLSLPDYNYSGYRIGLPTRFTYMGIGPHNKQITGDISMTLSQSSTVQASLKQDRLIMVHPIEVPPSILVTAATDIITAVEGYLDLPKSTDT